MRRARYQTQFKRDFKLAEKRGKDLAKLAGVMADLEHERPLSPLRRDHALTGEWSGYRECHLEGDWLLVYRIDAIPKGERTTDGPAESVTFARTGSHADLFD